MPEQSQKELDSLGPFSSLWIVSIHSLSESVAEGELGHVCSLLKEILQGFLRDTALSAQNYPPPSKDLWGNGTLAVYVSFPPTLCFPSHSPWSCPIGINGQLGAVNSFLWGNLMDCLGEIAEPPPASSESLGQHRLMALVFFLMWSFFLPWKATGRCNLSVA